MISISEQAKTKQLTLAIVVSLALGTSVAMSSHAQETDGDPATNPDLDIVLVEVPEDVPDLGDEVPDTGELPGEPEPLPVLPEGIALDSDGNAYPEGGPAGLYTAIVDKQQKLAMTGIYDADGNLVSVTYEGGNQGLQTALSRLRENMERKLNKDGLLDDGAVVPEGDPLAEDVGELSDVPGDVAVEETEPLPALPEDVALDNDGNAYEEGGPAGLYNAITDKQQKLSMEGVYDADGNLVSVTYEGGNSGLKTALTKLRENLERKLKKLGLFDDAAEVPDTGETGDATTDGLAATSQLGISQKSAKLDKPAPAKSQKPQKPEKAVKAERLEKTTRPVRAERVERPQKPTKVTRVERPQRPEKIARVEKPQRPEKISRVEKPQRPQKPQKPEKPNRPGRS